MPSTPSTPAQPADYSIEHEIVASLVPSIRAYAVAVVEANRRGSAGDYAPNRTYAELRQALWHALERAQLAGLEAGIAEGLAQSEASRTQELVRACQVISYDAKISTWLGENGPQALMQVRAAIKAAGAAPLSPIQRHEARVTNATEAKKETQTHVDAINRRNAVLTARDTAMRALDEKFDSITDMTFLREAEEDAILALLDACADTLMLRSRERVTQRLGTNIDALRAVHKVVTRGIKAAPHPDAGGSRA